VSQFEESLPAFRYNSRGTGPALSTIQDEDGDAEVGVSFDSYAPLSETTESQMPPAAHSGIIYNTSGNPIARASGELLRSEPSEILDPFFYPCETKCRFLWPNPSNKRSRQVEVSALPSRPPVPKAVERSVSAAMTQRTIWFPGTTRQIQIVT
jgi:hypothetical protein